MLTAQRKMISKNYQMATTALFSHTITNFRVRIRKKFVNDTSDTSSDTT